MTEFNSKIKQNSRILKIFLFSICALFACAINSHAQSLVKGTVTDGTGEPLPGVSIVVKGTTNGTVTDMDGKYSIQAAAKDILSFSYIGMTNQDIKVAGRTVINIVMKDDVAALDEVIVVGYGVQKKQSLTGAVSAMKGDELLKAPSTNVTQMLAGKLAGISSVQESGEPGLDNASLRIRGSVYDAVYIVDGFPRSITDIDPNDIESISVLKDAASAAVYGLKAAGGVIIVTTKKGTEGKSKVTYDASFGASMNANFPKFMNGPQFAYYYNLGDMMDKMANGVITDVNEYTPVFSKQNVEDMLTGSNGWGNVNYIDKVFGTGFNQKHNVSIQGGTDKMRYYASAGYMGQKGNIDNFYYNRYNIRTNIEAQVARDFTMTVGIAGRSSKRHTPGFASGGTDSNSELGEQGWMSVANQTLRMHPYVQESYNGLYTATANGSGQANSPLAAIYESGYKVTRTTEAQTNISLQYNVPWVKGLSLKVNGSYDYVTSHNKNLDIPYYTEMITMPTTNITELKYANTLDPRGNTTNQLGEGQTTTRQLVGQGSIHYANTFGKHNVDFLALAEVQDWKQNKFSAYATDIPFVELPELDFGNPAKSNPISGGSDAKRSIGYVFRLKYDYDNKYLAEFTGRYDGSYKFAGNVSGKRWGFFPSGSVAWRISKESFMEDLTFIDDLKVRSSAGLLGADAITPYRFLSTYAYGDKVMIGGNSYPSMYTAAVPNATLTWENTLSYNVGFDFTMWNGLLGVDFDAFYNYTYDMLTSMSSNAYPASMGEYYNTYANYNKMDAKGIDVVVSHRNKFSVASKPFNYGVSASVTWAKNRWLRYASDYANQQMWFRVTGDNVYANYGWIAEGLYRTEEEIDKSAWYGSRPNIGDIKYRDLNGDGKIDWSDRARIGRNNRPAVTYGLTLNASWNGFDFNAQFTGGALFDVSLTGTYYNDNDDNTVWTKTFKDGANSPLYLVENAVSEYNPNGTFPRITAGGLTHGGDNGLSSTFWLRNGKYIRLKSAQLGYTLPRVWMDKVGIENLRLYVQGSNLFTISGLPDGIDPESPGVNNGYYPQQRTIMGGITLTF